MNRVSAAVGKALWGPDLAGRPAPVRLGYTVARHAYALLRDLFSGDLTLRAMGLVYISLLSTVPFLAFSFSLLKVFGVHNSLKPQLYGLLEPLGAKGIEITDAVILAVDNVETSVLGALSLAFFVYTAISMVQRVEATFNYIWQVARPRSLARRVTEYVAVLLVGPVVMTTALGLIASISSEALVQTIVTMEPFGTALVWAGEILPYLLVIGVFTFLYRFLPNAPVRLVAAAAGGVVAGASWSFVGVLFARLVAMSATRNAIYSTFAVAVSALVWLYVSWLILLLGAQIAFYVQNPAALRTGRQEPRLSGGLRERIALEVMYRVGQAFRSGVSPCTTAVITAGTGVPGLTLVPVIADLEAAGLISATQDEALVPGRDPARIRLEDIYKAVRQGCEAGALLQPAWSPPVAALAGGVDAAIGAAAGDRSLSELLDEGDASRGST